MQKFVENVKTSSPPLPGDTIMFNGELVPGKYSDLPPVEAEVLAVFITFFLMDENKKWLIQHREERDTEGERENVCVYKSESERENHRLL